MSKSLSEFKRFLKKSAPTMSDYEKKLVNLILDGFDEIAASSTAGGKRGKILAGLIVKKGDAVSSELKIDTDEERTQESQVIRLNKVIVENFRGFSDKQAFEFKNPYTFVYGPNGTGKSSLCEALEFGLLGSIHEADSKRIPTLEYIKNAISKKTGTPILYGDTLNAKNVVINPDPGTFEFCFIEKNRIDGFARVAANTPSAQQTRLAALFGLEEFNAFATQFNESIDSYLDCIGKKGKDLADREKGIAGHKATLEGIPAKTKDAETRCSTLFAKYQDCKTIAEIKIVLVGPDGNGGKQKANNTEIGRLQNIKQVLDPETIVVLSLAEKLLGLVKEKGDAEVILNQYKDQLSLRDLYGAILNNREKFENVCPACTSELYRDGNLVVPVDPYDQADEKLKQFDAALAAEEQIEALKSAFNLGWLGMQAKIAKLPTVAASVGFAQEAEIGSLCGEASDAKEATDIERFLNSIQASGGLLRALNEAVVAFNVVVEESKAAIKKLEEENLVVANNLEEIVAISTLIAANEKSEVDAKDAIDKFNQANDALIKDVDAEKPGVVRNIAYNTAYSSFRRKLLDYNAALPIFLAADLNEKSLKFYNEIKKNDHPSDTLKSLTLPTAVGKKLEIEYKNGEKCDALQVLSEGHIRCLGLAILLAKITRDDLPFLIFDDVVNSIDDAHRSAIIDLILNSEEVGNRQLIVTTHGEDFVKRLENAIPMKKYKDMVTRIDFLAPFSPKKINVRLDLPRHYLVVAQQSYDEGRIRDSLSYVRKSFEELLNRLWKKIASKKLSTQLSVGMRGPGVPDLMSLATGLYQLLDKKDVEVFQGALPCLAEIIGKGDRHQIKWNYLNKGTHEEDRVEEFDPVVVRHMLNILIQLDEAIESPDVLGTDMTLDKTKEATVAG
nr:AAA family ATPase [uncultured Deefgea sp.]